MLIQSFTTNKRILRGKRHIKCPTQIKPGNQVEVWKIHMGQWLCTFRTVAEIHYQSQELRFENSRRWISFFTLGLTPFADGGWHKHNHLRWPETTLEP